MPAHWRVRPAGENSQHVELSGEFDLAAEAPLIEAVDGLARSGTGLVVLDLANVNFIDSSGVRALLKLHRDHGDRVRLGPMSPAAQRVLRIAGLYTLFDVVPLDDEGSA
jgi:anti-sigma B factor antagonist